MKSLRFILIGLIAILGVSCSNDDTNSGEQALFAVPVVKSLASIRSSVSVTTAKQTQSDGKIYVAENYLFYIAQESGVHVFNNANPASPQNVAYINIEGVHDIAVKGNYLFADNYVDLLVFDISNINNITLVQTLENTISFNPVFPTTAEFYDYTVAPGTNEFIASYRLESRKRPTGVELVMANDAMGEFSSSGGVGTGGSYAKFQINGNALYIVDSYQLNVFNISNPTNTSYDEAVFMESWFGGGQLETLFLQKDFLFVGATTGMHIVNVEDEFNPYFVSAFSHATACDPVVVNGTTAYITVRGGNSCGAIEDQLNVIDVSDVTNPTLISTYLLSQPRGLGVRGNSVYVCCGSDGLKVFNASDSSNLVLDNSYSANVTDVIPLNSHLIAVGTNKIIQYNYGTNNTLEQISVLDL